MLEYYAHILEKGEKYIDDFAQRNLDDLLDLFSLYVSMDNDYKYNSTYLMDKIDTFYKDISNYYKKRDIIEASFSQWNAAYSIKMYRLRYFEIEFDEMYIFKTGLGLQISKIPNLDIIRNKDIYIKMKCILKNEKTYEDYVKVKVNDNHTKTINNIIKVLKTFSMNAIKLNK